ncbi:MAM and LDL-receptor class A domain-containing protein 2-like isoform X1 [Arapaima gigas]
MRPPTCLLLGLLSFLEVLSWGSASTDHHCPEGHVKCTSQECISTASVCDCYSDYSNGSDEQFCGSCDFDVHSCNWTDISSGSFQWRLEMANITSIPGKDHTTGSPFGGMMHVEGSAASLFSEAKLEIVLHNRTPIGCHIIFWYHLYDSIGISSDFSLHIITRSSTKELWKVKKGQTNGWENATVHIGNRPAASKLLFSVKPTLIGTQNVALDDVRLSDCSEWDVPTGSSQLSCSYEDGACAWFTDEEAPSRWRRTNGKDQQGGPGHDHTTGSGYYMLAASSHQTRVLLTSRLMSYPQTAGITRCISFWYHMYGGGAGALKFLSRSKSGLETIEWMRSGTQGNKWWFVDLHIEESSSPVQFIFEASVGGAYGSIAIDDVVVSEAQNRSCPADRECTFQGSCCGLLGDITGHFNWTRTTGVLSINTTSPALDHTLGTNHGYYLSAQMWKHPAGHMGRVLTSLSDPTPKSGECLNFWYHMEGEGVGMLRVYLQKLHSSRELLWTISGDQGELWRHARVTVLSDDTPYQVVFEAVAEDGLGRDIAIDDLLMLNGPCPPQGFCDFETDLCSWVRALPASDGVHWDWTSASATNAGRVPPVDHTTNSDLGHYIYYRKEMMMPATTAHLLSEYMKGSSSNCLVFWYYIDLVSHLEDVRLTVYVNNSTGLHPVWSESHRQGTVWLEAQLDYKAAGRHQILFEAKSQRPYDVGSIALDDIYIKTGITCADLAATTAAPTTEPPTIQESPMDCSFETGLCSWVQETGDAFDWVHQKGEQVLTPEDAPRYDHSLGNEEGYYLMISALGTKDDETANISIPMMLQSTDVCLSFWYHMWGSSICSLELLVETNELQTVVWKRSGTQAAEWLNAQVTISMTNIQRVKLSGRRKTVGSGFIAIDDITARMGPCMDQELCGFENPSICGYEQDVMDDIDWIHTAGTGNRSDHTYQTQLGHSMAVFGEELHQQGVAMLRTSEFPATAESCVQFWYWLQAGGSDSLSVHVTQGEELGPALWLLPGGPYQGWEVAQVTVSSPTRFRVVFRAEMDAAPGSFMLLDDVSVRGGVCVPTGSCDFESGQCTWRNWQSNGHDWVQADGHFSGPGVDHTTGTPDGGFLLNPAQNQVVNQSSKAVLVSERFQKGGVICFSFWYHMNTSGCGVLRTYLWAGISQVDLFFETRGGGHTWTKVSHTVLGPKGFQVAIEAEAGSEGFIAIDDLLVTPGPCDNNETTTDFLNCTFEMGLCSWEDISEGQFTWLRDRNGTTTENTGPSVDHTTGTELGWYMAVEAQHGDRNSYAALYSPTLKESSSQCVLEFYYHMFGKGIGQLSILRVEGSRHTQLWKLSGDQGDDWRRATVDVGRIPGLFRLLFKATRTYSTLGDIAIDDVAFLNCSLPESEHKCLQDDFRCFNGVCVDPSTVCDFSDDCGDRSDEIDCELRGFLNRCSFEHGLCLWQQSDLDSPGAEWVRQSGETALSDHVPPRDHTRNSAAGHYAVPGTHLSSGGTSEMLSTTLLPSFNCTVRFYHYTHGSSSGQLTLRLRNVHSASNDRVLWVQEESRQFFWERAEVTFSSAVCSKIVLEYKRGTGAGGDVAVDDISFSSQCTHDPENTVLPQPPSPSTPPTPSPSVTPCKAEEFFCWLSVDLMCISASLQCDYVKDCPQGEDEENCGPCSFETSQCEWVDITEERRGWYRQKATGHTTGSGFYMSVNASQVPLQNEARLLSPSLPPSSPYCQMRFHFRVRWGGQGGLNVFLRESNGSETLLWTCCHSSNNQQWKAEVLSVGQMKQPYRIVFSSLHSGAPDSAGDAAHGVDLDDISFSNCEMSYSPPALSALGCSFDEHACSWLQAANDDLDWVRWTGPSSTPNTGPTGDHISDLGYYLYMESSSPSEEGQVAEVRSPLLPPAGHQGYCLTFWFHMFGATVGTLKSFLHESGSPQRTLVWQRAGTQSDQWQVAHIHITLQKVHQVVMKASVGGWAGDIGLDDISFISGSCPFSDLCNFEESNCGWTPLESSGDQWQWRSPAVPGLDIQPNFDHTTNTSRGHFFYMDSSKPDTSGHLASMASQHFPAGKEHCFHFWYHMQGKGVGSLKIYQQDAEGRLRLSFFQTGSQGLLWRHGRATMESMEKPFQMVVEGVRGPGLSGNIAIDDVQLSPGPCLAPGYCDFQTDLCGWTNVGTGDQADWLWGHGALPTTSTGPRVDHTTGSGQGYYMYVDSAVGHPKDSARLYSEVFQPTQMESCFSFWYHVHGWNIGTLSLYSSDRTPLEGEEKDLVLLWEETDSETDGWREVQVSLSSEQPFWLVFIYEKGEGRAGHAALDDTWLTPGTCSALHSSSSWPVSAHISLAVGVLLLVILVSIAAIILVKRLSSTAALVEEHDINMSFIEVYDFKQQPDTSHSFANCLYVSGTGTESEPESSQA